MSEAELKKLCQWVSSHFADEGRFPVLAVTSSINLTDKFKQSADPSLQKAKDYLLLYRLNSSEEYLLEQVGLARADCKGFSLELSSFTSKFINRLNALERALFERFHQWRQGLNERGLIAWPLKGSQKLNDQQRQLLQNGWEDLLVRSDVKALSHYDKTPQQVDLGELSSLVASLGVPQQMRNEGYLEQEWSQLFTSTEPNYCEAQMPVFLSRIIATRLYKHKPLTFEQAKQEWFWGYNWIVSPKVVFNDWMAILQSALLVEEEAVRDNHRQSQWSFIPKEQFSGRLEEAENWLHDDYPELIDKIQDLFGEGRIRDLFAPVKANKVGTKTNLAVTRLKKAKKYYQEIKQLEEVELPVLVDQWDSYRAKLVEVIQHRYSMKRDVDWVFQHEPYQGALQSRQFANLDFEQDQKPLWERLAKAKAFADQVYQIEAKVSARVTELITEIDSDNEAKPPFPRNLFTLSLQNIAHIFSAAIKPDAHHGETVAVQNAEEGTLSFYLRDLNVNQAIERLELLSKEVGFNPHSEKIEAINDIQGIIISQYRNLKSEFSKLIKQLADYDTPKISDHPLR